MKDNKPNTGVLFKNDKKETDKHPDYTGNIVTESGEEKRLAAWINESKSGKKYMSLQISEFKPKEEPKKEAGQDDDLPF